MRIGTWNLEGRGGDAQTTFLLAQDCDVLLLTEVNDALALPGYSLTGNCAQMRPGKRWAAVAARRPLRECPSPHPATAAAVVDDTTYVSSILPWRGSGGSPPWQGDDHATRVDATLATIEPFLAEQPRLVWGGDWNHSLAGDERVGSARGRAAILDLVQRLGLTVPTAHLPHRDDMVLAIDHVAVRWRVRDARRVVAAVNGRRLSDHDLSLVDVDPG